MRWLVSLTQWTWIWATSRRQWRTGKPDMLQSMVSERVRYVTEQQQLRESSKMTLWIWDATFHGWWIWCLYRKMKGDRHWGALLLRGWVFLSPFCRCRNWGQEACNTLSPSDEWQGHPNWFLSDSKPKILSTVLWLSIHWEVLSGVQRRHLDNKPRFFCTKECGKSIAWTLLLTPWAVKLWGKFYISR